MKYEGGSYDLPFLLELFGLSGAMPAQVLGDGFTGIFPSNPARDTWVWYK
jgi:hypothetical protein